ncbi:MAG: glycosyltransferase family 2 protein [Planctomycetes bacterium]|nr:glycosyltransferase family 2 protein [Planctomycetota bacterium]
MKISLLIATYERPDALRQVLQSVVRQTVQPDEVIIGDDGSGPRTADVITEFKNGGLPITHAWLPHDGFRPARMRNHSVAHSTGDYLIITDEDVVLHPRFVEDHRWASRPGFFVQGTRALLREMATADFVESGKPWPSLFAYDIGNRKNLFRSRLLARLCSRTATGLRGIRTANFALWRDDFVRVNGFNEEFIGWGREDSEFVTRLFNAGVQRKNLKFTALGCHLYHPPRSREGLVENEAVLATTIDKGATRCSKGFSLHVKDRDGAAPVVDHAAAPGGATPESSVPDTHAAKA